MRRDIVLSVLAAVFVSMLSIVGVPGQLGAHPFWQQSVGLIGAIAGGMSAFFLRRVNVAGAIPAVTAGVLTATSFGTAHVGKTRFAASFAEDAMAGQVWYFGWIATAAFATVTLALALRRD